MKKYLLPETGNFYKANLHCHTVLSDGEKTPEEVKKIYKDKGYSIVAYTDHDLFIPHPELADEDFLPLNGFEMEITNWGNDLPFDFVLCCHICFIGIDPDNHIQPMWHRSDYLYGNAPQNSHLVKFDENEPDYEREFSCEGISEIMNIAREKGFFVTYNHPVWSMENYTHYSGYNGMHAMEMFNGGCIAAGYDEFNHKVYDDILRTGKKIYCIGGDDNHNGDPVERRRCDSGWAFTMIKADKLEYRTVTQALLDGNFYASEGPEIYSLWVEDDRVYVKCSDADRINCTYMMRRAETMLSEYGETVNEASFSLRPEYGYFRITVVDKQGRRACTNAYFTEDIFSSEE